MRLTAMLLLLSVWTVESAVAQRNPLDAHRWRHRVLLVFTQSLDAQPALQLSRALEERACEVSDRELVIGWLSATDASRLGTELVATDVVVQWRARLGVNSDEFTVVLVGKDGGAKARYEAVPDLAELFAIIDGMPMRRAEMRARPDTCAR